MRLLNRSKHMHLYWLPYRSQCLGYPLSCFSHLFPSQHVPRNLTACSNVLEEITFARSFYAACILHLVQLCHMHMSMPRGSYCNKQKVRIHGQYLGRCMKATFWTCGINQSSKPLAGRGVVINHQNEWSLHQHCVILWSDFLDWQGKSTKGSRHSNLPPYPSLRTLH